jgi:DNA repair protein RecN (Recombination protein N)
MLNQLTIRNYVLVDQLDITFDAGLTGITGESGAGKSILLGALGLLMGDRAKADSVRPGADKADISAEFALRPESVLHQRLTADELIDAEDEYCLVRRVVTTEGSLSGFHQQCARHPGIPERRLGALGGHSGPKPAPAPNGPSRTAGYAG